MMTRHGSAKNIGRLLAFCLMIFAVASCTKDYFVDETNFRLYVPQIKNNEITNFYVAFHDQNGKQVYTRALEAPFDKDDLMKEGILRFKLYPTKYTVSCFADYAPGSLTSGNISYTESDLAYSRVAGQSNLYQPLDYDTRALFMDATALPIGDPNCKNPITADINESTRFMARVGTQFVDLPPIVTRIDIYYSGIATRLRFGGTFARFSVSDVAYTSIQTAAHKSGNTVDYTRYVNPSSEVELNYVNPSRGGANDPKELTLRADFYNGNQLVGEASYPGPMGSNDAIPTYYDGSPASDLVLDPRKTINFKFQGYTIVEIKLIGWGDITGGETTPL